MIESITATVPVTGQSYTDLRPTISASSIEEYRQQLAEVGRLAGNDAFVERMLGPAKVDTTKLEKLCTDNGCVYFDHDSHAYYDSEGTQLMSGSKWSGQFEKPFDSEMVAKQVANKRLTTPDVVLKGWELKGDVSCTYGTAVHKAIECAIKYGEMPNNPHLLALVQDYMIASEKDEQVSEQFVLDLEHKICGVIDVLVNKGNKHVVIRDFKTSDVYKKVSLTPEAKEKWNLKGELLSIYQLQLSFYAFILKNMGYKVDGLEIWAEAQEAWDVIKLPVLDIEEAL